MATLVLTVVGGAIGGPVGAAIGASLGNAVDRTVLFAPKGREGPRLTELKVQTSSYGTQIPRLFGTMRVAGSVIWATDLQEHRSTESGGKGQPGVTRYSYTASFAVALSARPVIGVGRIWADGKLLRGAGGDFKARTGFRLHRGSEDQAADPLIAAAEGALAPAHRGIAYAVFEDLDLTDFGNRIPSLTFEVTADAGPVAAGAIAAELGGVACEAGGAALAGFSAYGASVRVVLDALAGAAGGWFAAGGDGLVLRYGDGAAVTVADAGVQAGKRGTPPGSRALAAPDSAPRAMTLSYYDPARDYQTGVQRAVRPGAGTREAQLELPAAIGADAALGLAEAALMRMDLERERRRVSIGWDGLRLLPGDRVAIAGVPGSWRVDRWSFEAMVLTLECVAIAPAPLPARASSGRVSRAPDLGVGATLLQIFELPPLDDALASVPRLAIAATGGAGWRRAALLLAADDGAWAASGSTALPAVLGTVVAAPGAGSWRLEDRCNRLDVRLARADMLLNDADAAALDAGANCAMVGDELLQFARAEPLGDGLWRLSGLRRGLRGTERAIDTQAAGERFVLIAADALAVRELAGAGVGTQVRVLAQGVGDADEGVAASAVLSGISRLPPAPVHLAARADAAGATMLGWVRRGRSAWRWLDGADAPLGEERERYRVTVRPEGGAARDVEVDVPEAALSASDRARACRIEVRQIGTYGASPPAILDLEPLGG